MTGRTALSFGLSRSGTSDRARKLRHNSGVTAGACFGRHTARARALLICFCAHLVLVIRAYKTRTSLRPPMDIMLHRMGGAQTVTLRSTLSAVYRLNSQTDSGLRGMQRMNNAGQ